MGLYDKGSCQGNPLFLSTAQVHGEPGKKVANAQEFRQLAQSLFAFPPAYVVETQSVPDVFQNAQMREKGLILIDDSHLSFFGRQRRDLSFPDENSSSIRANQPGNGFKKNGLAGSGGSHEHEEFILFDLQVDVPEMKLQEPDVQIFDADHVSFAFLMARTRRRKKSMRQTRTSQTATGWEYFKP